MDKYFNFKSTTDLIDSIINGKRLGLKESEKEISLDNHIKTEKDEDVKMRKV